MEERGQRPPGATLPVRAEEETGGPTRGEGGRMANAGSIPPVTILLYHDILPPGSAPTADQGGIPFDVLAGHFEALRGAGFRAR